MAGTEFSVLRVRGAGRECVKKGIDIMFTELDAWKEARVVVKLVYDCTLSFPKEEMYSLQSQVKRSVISIPSNIAEVVAEITLRKLCIFFILRGVLHMN
jgi:hypothetical protein